MSSSLFARSRRPVAVRRTVQRDADIARITRYRGGMYSPTVDAYSLDFLGVAPTRPSQHRSANWSAVSNTAASAVEAEVDWIIRNSVLTLGATELSRWVRAAGHCWVMRIWPNMRSSLPRDTRAEGSRLQVRQ